ncbi:MAG: hypothetical protein Q4G24_11580 [Paracoccus sp. (in: a-proteobacteria)]|uniref:hypothetical protein n=1 Tax=Paracoccus sp. TaxID=267 RepID=UPI0026E04AFF|nr:hypothetical protein [Paracoccus sp. (in: a-proteobacteria)]MDO5622096.1 hypothetical protein [Paracoccus sp. (in: a-proteobacteria)]
MLGFLDFLGTLGSNVIGLPGILGLALGMMTRNWIIAAIAGGIVGIGHVLMFYDLNLPETTTLTFVVAVVVGVAFGILGCLIRRKGALV